MLFNKTLKDKYRLLTFEIDDCDKNANILGELFMYKPNYSWNTYIKDLWCYRKKLIIIFRYNTSKNKNLKVNDQMSNSCKIL